MTDRAKGNIALLMTAMLWGTGFIAQKLGNEVLPPIAFNAIRQIMAAIVIMPVLAVSMKKSGYLSKTHNSSAQLSHKHRRMALAGLICGFFLMFGTTTQQIGLLTVSAGKSGFISSMYIVFVPVFAAVVGERVRLGSVGCIGLAMVGFAVMSLTGGFGKATAGDWLTLASAAGFAAQIVSVNYFLDKDNALLISVLQMGAGGIMGLTISLMTETITLEAVSACMPILLYSTFIPTAMGYTLQIVGQKYTEPSTAALLMSLESVFAAVFGAIFLAEMMSMREIAGSLIILTATILGQRVTDDRRAADEQSAAGESTVTDAQDGGRASE